MNRNKTFIIFLITVLAFVAIALLFLNDSRYRYPKAYLSLNLPIFTNSRVTTTYKETKDGKTHYFLDLKSPSNIDEISGFYKSELRKAGWDGPKKLKEDLSDNQYYKRFVSADGELKLYIEQQEANSIIELELIL